LRRVKYYKHVKSDLCYNITWRNRPTELAGEQQLTRWMFSSKRDYRTYLSPLQLKGTVELVAVSQLSSYQPAKLFLLFVHGSKPLSKNTRVHRLWDTPRRRTFLKILDNPDRLQATEVIQKNCYQSTILVTWKTEMPRNTYSWQKDIEDKIASITDRYRYWGLR